MGNVFVKPPKGTDLREEHKEMMTADHHNANLYDEEADAQGGEKIDPVTGRPMKNKRAHGDEIQASMRVREVEDGGDLMGDIPDPNAMTLEELIRTQNEV